MMPRGASVVGRASLASGQEGVPLYLPSGKHFYHQIVMGSVLAMAAPCLCVGETACVRGISRSC